MAYAGTIKVIMALLDYRKIQLEKRKKLLATPTSPYPLASKRTHNAADAVLQFAKLLRGKKELFLAGRVTSLRRHGGIMFGDIKDASGSIQFLLRKDNVGDKAYKGVTDFVDVGDIIELRGIAYLTKSKEKTVDVSSLRLLAKSIRPLPAEWEGLQDVEERYRKRYLDLLMNPAVKDLFQKRSVIFKAVREFLYDEGFMEVETPILQKIPGGASARPFKTYLNALELDLYLRVAPELYLKRLIAGGLEKVFEIGRSFRNEGMDHTHNPDFTMLEFYWAYADYKDMMKLTERLIIHTLKTLATSKGTSKAKFTIEYEGKKIDFSAPWERVEFVDLLRRCADVDYESLNREALAKKAKSFKIVFPPKATKAQIADALYKKVCLPTIKNPTFILHHPLELTPLAKSLPDRPEYAARFQVAVAGWELVNAFSELNDPVVQRERLVLQEKQRSVGDEEAHRLDEDFIEALEYGMPPAAGFGMGMDRLTALLTGAHSLREAILFPLMKSK